MTVSIDNLVDDSGTEIPGIYHVNINIDGYPPDDNQCTTEFSLQFDFKDGSNVVYTHEIETPIIGNANGLYEFWRTEDFIHDFVVYVPPAFCSGGTYNLSQIDNVDITSTFYQSCGSIVMTNNWFTVQYPDPSVNDHVFHCLLSNPDNPPECTGTSFTQNIAGISLPENVPLDFIVAESHNVCNNSIDAAAWAAYALPYGGCPNYTHSWIYFDGTATQPAEYVSDAEPNTGNPAGEGIWGRTDVPYSVTITDQSSPTQTATASNIYFDDFVELIDDVTFTPKTSCSYTITVDLADWLPTGTNALIYDFPYDPNAAGAVMSGNTITRPAGTYVIKVVDINTQCEDFQTVELTGGVTTISGPVFINNQQTWSPATNNIYVVSDKVHVTSSGILDIENVRVEFAGPDAGIIVERGGKLYVGNSTLTAQPYTCAGNPAYWWGIQVKGDPGYAHPPLSTPITDPLPTFGVVNVRENSTIERAAIALRVYDQDTPTSKIYGGGIVVAETGSAFLNCNISIYMAPYKYKNRSRVRQCFFDINTPLLAADHSLANFIHLFLVNTKLQVYDNEFHSYTGFDIEERGTGIVSMWADVISGQYNASAEPDPTQGNKFIGLYKGLDAYGLGGYGGKTEVLANNFNNVAKCITVNANAYARIVENTIQPAYPHYPGVDTYGVYLSGATGCLVSGNVFKGFPTSDPTIANTHYGIIARNTGKGGGRIHENFFQYRFHAGTQFEADNAFLEVTCNMYDDANNYDWLITNSGILKDQGYCDPTFPANSEPSLNQWHECTGGSDYHVGNFGAPFTLTYYNEPQYQPTCVTGGSAVGLNFCTALGESNCDPIIFKSTAQLKTELSQSTEEAKYRNKLNELMHAYLHEEKADSAKMDLETENKTYTDKILIATHTEEEDFTTALAKLAQLPLNTTDDVAFHDLITAIINDMINGSGKTESENVAYIAESEPNGAVGVLAESVLAYHTGILYDRNAEKMAVAHSSGVDINPLRLYPNPATNYVEVCLTSNSLPEGSILKVFDKTGKLAACQKVEKTTEVFILPTQNLRSGIYLVYIQLPDGGMMTQKLIVTL